MDHIKYITGENDPERWTIDRENMRRCIMYKCPYLSLGTCLKSRRILIHKEDSNIINLMEKH